MIRKHAAAVLLCALTPAFGWAQESTPTVESQTPVAIEGSESVAAADPPLAPVPETGESPPAMAPAPANPAPPSAGTGGAPAGGGSVWKSVPPAFVFSRPGEFTVPPDRPGYYSLGDALRGNYLQKPPASPYGRTSLKPYPFYDADFRYLDNPNNTQFDWSDVLKRRQIGDSCWMFTTGGEVRNRFMNEVDARLSGKNNNYDLLRTMIYGSLWYEDQIGLFVQGMDAQIFGEDLLPTAIDLNGTDVVDLFIDYKLLEIDDKPVYVRGGRQELNLGSQRLVSDLEWANTLRTFDGVRIFRQSEKWDVSLFWMQPVVIDPSNFDKSDNDRNFTGVWTTYRPEKGHFVDVYALNLDQARNLATGAGGVKGQSNITTLGTRYAGNKDAWLWDLEGMLQVGEWSNQNLFAGAASAGAGYLWADACWKPQLWFTYDYASGDANPGQGNSFNTFQQMFPFGHYYFGYLDLVGRQNIHDFHAQFVAYPTPWITFLSQFHHFQLDSARSPLFGAAGAPIRQDPTGAAGKDVGNEIDFLVNFHLGTHQDILVGYSKLFAGRFIEETGPGGSPELFYLQHQYRW